MDKFLCYMSLQNVEVNRRMGEGLVNDIRPLIAGNWKMNGGRREALKQAGQMARRAARRKAARAEVLICPPAVLIPVLREPLAASGIALGAQDCHANAAGAHTGDQGAEMLADAGCSHVIVGHSERRADHGETDAIVRAKAEAAHRAGMVAIVCVGETRTERRRGKALEVVARQLARSLPKGSRSADTVVAYEPVWAIGTGLVATVDDVAEMHAMIRARLARRFRADGRAMRILYGGSVNAGNAETLLGVADVDGALVGGASLTAKAFMPIVKAAG